MIQTPDHSTYPSGHALEAFALATVLHFLMTPNRPTTQRSAAHGIANNAQPFRLAARISVNRTVAGVNCPVDSLVGAQLGCFLGHAMLAQSGADLGADNATVTYCTELDDADGTHSAVAGGFTSADDFMLSKIRAKPLLSSTLEPMPTPTQADDILARAFGLAQTEWNTAAWPK